MQIQKNINDFLIPDWQSEKHWEVDINRGKPLFAEYSLGPYFYTPEKKKYIDFLMGWGSIIIGHADKGIQEVIFAEAQKGLIFNSHHPVEIQLASTLKGFYPFEVHVGYFLNGSDAVSAAVRIARAATGKEGVLFSGYHGWHDWSQPFAKGVPIFVKDFSQKISIETQEQTLDIIHAKLNNLACLVFEVPLASSFSVPFFQYIKKLSVENNFLIIFDEIKSGIRLGFTPGVNLYKIYPDMVIYGKAFSGGLPLSLLLIDTKYANITSGTALAATYWGYPLAIHVAEHIINRFRKENLLDTLQENSSYFFSQLSRIFQDQGIDFRFEGPSAMPVFVTGENNFLIQTFYQRCFQLGLYFRRPGKNWFVSTSHTQQVLDESLEKFEMAIKKTKKNIPMRRL